MNTGGLTQALTEAPLWAQMAVMLLTVLPLTIILAWILMAVIDSVAKVVAPASATEASQGTPSKMESHD